jgi:predicted AlkP superfamily phosphohydrolase/phosphomutase
MSGMWAYIDPTGGLPPSMWGMYLAALFSALGAGLTLLRVYGRWLGQLVVKHVRLVALVIGLIVVAGTGFWLAGRTVDKTDGRRVLVLALDGLDPRLLDQYLAEGRLPHLARLARTGCKHNLATTVPPQSPVAWSSFWTGTGPSDHGVYDFIKRDPATYRPDLAIADRKTMRLPWEGRPFWDIAGAPTISVVAQRAPLAFPPPRLDGRLLAGMGVWDARGTEGTYFFWSTRPVADKDARGMVFDLQRDGAVFKGEIPGPYYFGQADTLREPFTLEPAADGSATLHVQGQAHRLPAGRWSDWIPLQFPRGPLQLQKLKTLTRALWHERDGTSSLYIAPLNFDPAETTYAISWPRDYAAELATAIGPYHTRGMPFDTQALTDGVLDEKDFLAQCRLITQESEAMLFAELPRFRDGLLFAYFEEADVVQHLFWRAIDTQSPLFALAETRPWHDVIPDCYERCDALVGRAWAALGDGGTLIVLSDHGFAPFRRAIHLNAILGRLGYLHADQGKIDWSRTRAYALGFNSLYLNLAGREGKGTVAPADAQKLLDEITSALTAFIDPETKDQPIVAVHPTSRAVGPDLIVGYRSGARASWETALGQVPSAVSERNTKKWSGDHCIDAALVPGVFLSSDPALDVESLQDVGPRIVRYLRGQ